MMIAGYGKVGRLTVMVVKGSELEAGDVITIGDQMSVIVRSYSVEHLRWQNLDIENGRQDEDGEYLSPYPIHVSMDENFTILRALGLPLEFS